MSDWADETADKLLWQFMTDDDFNASMEAITAALRTAREAALEDAAKSIENMPRGITSDYWSGYHKALIYAAERVRALKEITEAPKKATAEWEDDSTDFSGQPIGE